MKKQLLIAAGVALVALPGAAQRLKQGYLVWPESGSLHTYIQQWKGGEGQITVKSGQTWEDENFFISRVKPKERFYNVNTQVYSTITQYDADKNPNGNDKRLIFWVPVGEQSRQGIQLNSLADGVFDGEVFNMWSYVDHWGDWNSPFGWVPGNFADVAHKNGVAVSGVASVPFGGITDSWRQCFQGIVQQGGDAVGKWLYYHGVDGLGYNSEWTGYAPYSVSGNGLTTLHSNILKYMEDRNPVFENIWYGGTLDNGSRQFDCGITGSTNIYKSASMFLNYNWNWTSTMTNAIAASKGAGKSPFYLYAGMNMQGGEPSSGSNYDLLSQYQYSIGLWGAHSVNMFWQDRYNNGSSDEAKIRTYLKMCEQWFGNGPRNPAIKKEIRTNRSHRPTDDWAGMSSMMSARSTLSWDLSEEPFYTFFNIGNGKFFNWKGERQNNNSWHNIGVQDYQPTWHYWIAPDLCKQTVNPGQVTLNADVTWEDAYVGGSCLKLSGATQGTEYLHLFKTDFDLKSDYELVVSYRLIDGSADVDVVFSTSEKPATVQSMFELFKADECSELADDCYDNGWKTVSFPLSDMNLGMIALQVKDAKNLSLLLGQLSIRPVAPATVPVQPVIKVEKQLVYNVSGVDGKLVWDMPYPAAKPGEPVYNTDVNTSVFQLWAQQEGEDEVMMGLTTSWAGFIFGAPVKNDGLKRIKFGVSAASLDTEERSEITWSKWFDLDNYDTIDDIVLDKTIIKPDQEFTISFVDPQHKPATWTLYDSTGKQMDSKSGVTVATFEGLHEIGGYDLKVEWDGGSQSHPYYVSISPEGSGALPEIKSLSVGSDEVTDETEFVRIEEVNEPQTFSYTGRNANGFSSRGVDLNENWFGVSVKELKLQDHVSFSIAAWVRYDELPAGRSNFITVEDRTTKDTWPYNNWGYFWSRINEKGGFVDTNIDTTWGWRLNHGRAGDGQTEKGRIFYRYDDARIQVGAWTHVAVVFEYETGTNKMRSRFYINGKEQTISYWLTGQKSSIESYIGTYAGGDWSQLEKIAQFFPGNCGADGNPPYIADGYSLNYGEHWITFGGSSKDISAVKGCVDDFQIWGKAMDDKDIALSMKGLNKNELPDDVWAYWDFENNNEDIAYIGYAGKNALNPAPKGYTYSINNSGENDNVRVFEQPAYLIGSPFIEGTAYPVITEPTWVTRHATVNVTEGSNDLAGSAKIAWDKEGDYTVTLRLANGHGEAVREYPVVKVGVEEIEPDPEDPDEPDPEDPDPEDPDEPDPDDPDPDDPDGIYAINGNADFTTYTVDDALFVEFDASGNYDVAVYDTNGVLVGKKNVTVAAGQNVSVILGVPGVYVLRVVHEGKTMRTVKVVRK